MTTQKLTKGKILKLLEQAFNKAFPGEKNTEIELEYPATQKHGDYSSNIAMQITKKLKIPPREIAEKIISHLPGNEIIEKAEIAGPGFINFYLSEKEIQNEIKTILKEKNKYGTLDLGKNKKIIIDYSSPNIAKPLGIHHLLSTIIGQSLYSIYEFLGYKSIGVNHIGDWGTQFGKLITAYKKWGDKNKIEKDPINEMLNLYVKFHDQAEKDPNLENEAREEFKKLEQNDPENKQLWQWFVEESLKDIKSTYEKLGNIKFDHYQGESFYEDKMDEILQEGKEKNIFIEGEEGAYISEFDDPDMPPFVVQKKDGATLYSTRDLATLKYRIDSWKPEKILYVVDIAQTLHFKQLFKTAEKFPWYHNEGFHVVFGRMHFKDKKMSTRKGNIVLLDEVLDQAIEKAKKIIEEKNPGMSTTEKEEIAKKVGIGGIKYSILSQNRTTDIVFDWEKILSLDGNSAPYLQYSYARAKSIIRRSEEKLEGSIKDPENCEEKIHELTGLLPRFKEKLEESAHNYKPNILCNYLYSLAQNFNTFYNYVPVLKAKSKEDQKRRIDIVRATSRVLKNGLNLLGVEVMEEM